MAVKWLSARTPGVRFYEHRERKHGVRFDRYYSIRFQHNGKRVEEGLGWASQGWTELKAAARIAELKENSKTGRGPQRLSEQREIARREREVRAAEEKRLAVENVTFGEVYRDAYLPEASTTKKPDSMRRERNFFELWAGPVIAKLPIRSVSPFHVEKIKKAMLDAGQSPRSVEYCLAFIRQVFNCARKHGLIDSESPTKKVAKPKRDNSRLRFLTREEAGRLLSALLVRSKDAHDMAAFSLYTGARFSEVAGVTWGDCDLDGGLVTFKDTNNSRSRTVPMSAKAREVLWSRERGVRSGLVFPAKNGGECVAKSVTFIRTVKELGFNEGLDDERQHVCFHTLRHTFCSWLVQEGVDLYTLMRLSGHKTFAMVQRYAHLDPATLRRAVDKIDTAKAKVEEPGRKVIGINERR